MVIVDTGLHGRNALGPSTQCQRLSTVHAGYSSSFHAPFILFPVLKLFFVHLKIQLRDALKEPLLRVSHGVVVDTRANFFQEETEKRASSDVADRLLHILLEVPLNGCNR